MRRHNMFKEYLKYLFKCILIKIMYLYLRIDHSKEI